MGLEILEGDINPNLMQQDIDDFVDDESSLQGGPLSTIDSRRRLEAKIEELQLMREMQEFDFDD